MMVSMDDFIDLIEERPALWQKSHRDFSNRAIRTKQLAEVGRAVGLSASESAKKLKNLKDTMRSKVAKLPKTESGSPLFSASHEIRWPYFHRLLFMKDEFLGSRCATLNIECDDDSDDAGGLALLGNYENLSGVQASEKIDSIQALLVKTEHENMSDVSNHSWDSRDDTRKENKRKRGASHSNSNSHSHSQSHSSQPDFRQRNMTANGKVPAFDEFETFALDIANDLRKIKSPLQLMRIKAKIRRVTEEFVISELIQSKTPCID
ncbi:transcription factor adf-1 [Plakobranchus ocellatus]|uniref:Transcription factor adf-1 n=1 Tax=Plakobranchus ocellatus TaxID=259542 RepID=A0AAV4CX54_9GAST|nr:transcription factor adf-1 [Plakobranchus ocellatus]